MSLKLALNDCNWKVYVAQTLAVICTLGRPAARPYRISSKIGETSQITPAEAASSFSQPPGLCLFLTLPCTQCPRQLLCPGCRRRLPLARYTYAANHLPRSGTCRVAKLVSSRKACSLRFFAKRPISGRQAGPAQQGRPARWCVCRSPQQPLEGLGIDHVSFGRRYDPEIRREPNSLPRFDGGRGPRRCPGWQGHVTSGTRGGILQAEVKCASSPRCKLLNQRNFRPGVRRDPASFVTTRQLLLLSSTSGRFSPAMFWSHQYDPLLASRTSQTPRPPTCSWPSSGWAACLSESTTPQLSRSP